MRGRLVPSEQVPHGSLPAYRWHKNHGETPCRPCKIAWNRYQAEYRATSAERLRRLKQEVKKRG